MEKINDLLSHSFLYRNNIPNVITKYYFKLIYCDLHLDKKEFVDDNTNNVPDSIFKINQINSDKILFLAKI